MKILVALSGGPQSLVTAWLLKKQGMQVRGIYFDLWGNSERNEKILELERKLGIPIQILNSKETFAEFLSQERSESLGRGAQFLPKESFHQKFLFPQLFDQAAQLKCEKVATGHRVTLQEDPSAGTVRVFRGAESKLEDALLLIGLKQSQIKSLLLPLGSIPESMMSKLIGEIAADVSTPSFEQDWALIEESIPPEMSGDPELQVVSVGGELIDKLPLSKLPMGGRIQHPTLPNQFYRVVELAAHVTTARVQDESQFSVEEVHFENASWFQVDDPGMSVLEVSLNSGTQERPLSMKLLQYEGGRVKGLFSVPVPGSELDIFKGQNVVWIENSEILGGAKVLRIK